MFTFSQIRKRVQEAATRIPANYPANPPATLRVEPGSYAFSVSYVRPLAPLGTPYFSSFELRGMSREERERRYMEIGLEKLYGVDWREMFRTKEVL